MESNEELYVYLKRIFYRDNHPKYHKYFEEWYSNLTPDQIHGVKLWYYWEQSHNLHKK